MEIIDAHAHIYPDKIAEKASDAIGAFYDLPMSYNGTTSILLEKGKMAGITRFLVHSVATTPHQVHSINEFIYSELVKHNEFIGFMTLHPDLTNEEVKEEIDWAISHGFKGIKLHPDFQKFNIDDPNVFKIYEYAEGKLPILFHTGDKRYDYSRAYRLVNVANKFPKLNVIAAHFGGYSCWESFDEYLKAENNNIYFDTSSSLKFLEPNIALKLIRTLGVDKFFFGTDYPMWDAKEELDRLNNIGLSNEEKELILGENLKRFLNL